MTNFEILNSMIQNGTTKFEKVVEYARSKGLTGEFYSINDALTEIQSCPVPEPEAKEFEMTAGNSQGIKWNYQYDTFTVNYNGGLYDGLSVLPFSCKVSNLNCEVWDVDGIEGQGTQANPYVIYWYKLVGNAVINAWEPYSFRNLTNNKIVGTNVTTAANWINTNDIVKRINDGYIAINVFRDPTTVMNTSTQRKWIAAYSGSEGIQYIPDGETYALNFKSFKGLYRDMRVS